jgi:hypothetical protein
MLDLDPSTRLYRMKGSVVIAQGPLTAENDGPKLADGHEIEIVLRDANGETSTATGAHGGLCSVATE